jgi:flagellar biogenesis protein FliO
MRKLGRFSCLVVLLASAAFGRARAAQQTANLEQLLLAELVEKPPEAPARATEKPRETAPASPASGAEVASAVPSIPYWPVLVLCLALGGAAWWLRKRPAGSAESSIRKLAALPLGGKRALMVVEVMGEKLLVGIGDHQLSLLANLEQKTSSAGGPAKNASALVVPRGLLEDHELASESYRPVPAEKQQLEEKFREFWSR